MGPSASGDWLDRDGMIACRQGGNWLFVTPADGMRVLDRSTGQELRYFGGSQAASAPTEPTGGTTVDSEARTALAELVAALRTSGIFTQS